MGIQLMRHIVPKKFNSLFYSEHFDIKKNYGPTFEKKK